MEKYYFKFEDLVAPEELNSMTDLCQHMNYRADEVSSDHEMFYGVLVNLFGLDGIYFATGNDAHEYPDSIECFNRKKVFIDKIFYTGDKYIPILTAMEEARFDLLAQISSTTTSQSNAEGKTTSTNNSANNSTPQTMGIQYDTRYANSTQMNSGEGTSLNQGHSSVTVATDGGSKAARIQEIVQAYENIYKLWLSEFKEFEIIA